MSGAQSHGSISQHWAVDTTFLSYFIAISGSYCTIQLMEQWRMQESKARKLFLLALSSLALGGCGIWSMHFTGMNALGMRLDDGTLLEVNFEAGMTIISFIFPVVGVFIGLKIASTDPFFLEVEQSRRKAILAEGLKGMSMDAVVKRSQVGKKIKFIALFSRLWRIAGGGLFAALGVLGMHYLGMLAQRTNAETHWNAGIIALSSIVAFVTANAAFWILFRALTFWPQYESLRIGSALIMGVAVCGTHYVGMGAASYEYSEENYADKSRFVFHGRYAAKVASHGSLLAVYWMSTFAVVTSLRKQVFANSQASTKSRASHAPENPSAASSRLKSMNNSVHPAPSGAPKTGPTLVSSPAKQASAKMNGPVMAAPVASFSVSTHTSH